MANNAAVIIHPMTHSYIGRFAPSPTGPLHFGTLIAALASYLQARSQDGQWLLRIEDVDVLRNVPNMDRAIIQSLQTFGFEWDGDIIYQTQRTPHYEEALQVLIDKEQVFYCTCSRKTLAETATQETVAGLYPGTCRERKSAPGQDHALRMRVNQNTVEFNDHVMGKIQQNLASECGDFIIKRRDGLFAYQLAVVVDDAFQGITEVVRGADLLDSTPRQIYLQQLLGYPQPGYLHLPLVINEYDQKLSKSTGAPALDEAQPVKTLVRALRHLGQNPPAELETGTLNAFWDWAIANWDSRAIPTSDQLAP